MYTCMIYSKRTPRDEEETELLIFTNPKTLTVISDPNPINPDDQDECMVMERNSIDTSNRQGPSTSQDFGTGYRQGSDSNSGQRY
jgi:hypothetical protein